MKIEVNVHLVIHAVAPGYYSFDAEKEHKSRKAKGRSVDTITTTNHITLSSSAKRFKVEGAECTLDNLEHAESLPPRLHRLHLLLGSHTTPLLPPSSAARKEDNKHAKEERHERSSQTPNPIPKRRPLPTSTVIRHVMVHNAENSKVDGERDERQDPGDEGDERAEQRAEHAGEGGDDECDEGQAALDGVQDHGAGEGVGGAAGDFVKVLRCCC